VETRNTLKILVRKYKRAHVEELSTDVIILKFI
jgi:hypothetical protein